MGMIADPTPTDVADMYRLLRSWTKTAKFFHRSTQWVKAMVRENAINERKDNRYA